MVRYNAERARDCDHSAHAEIPKDTRNGVVFQCGNCGAQVDMVMFS